MYTVLEIIDMRGTTNKVAQYDSMDKVNGFLKGKRGFYSVTKENNFINFQCFGDYREVLDFGTLN